MQCAWHGMQLQRQGTAKPKVNAQAPKGNRCENSRHGQTQSKDPAQLQTYLEEESSSRAHAPTHLLCSRHILWREPTARLLPHLQHLPQCCPRLLHPSFLPLLLQTPLLPLPICYYAPRPLPL